MVLHQGGPLTFGGAYAVLPYVYQGAGEQHQWLTPVQMINGLLLGAPLVKSTHGNLHFTAPLTGITAAVVGVIVNLAVFFAYHVLWPRGTAGDFEWLAAGIGVAAAIALFRFKMGVIPVVLASGSAGLVLSFLRPLLP